MWGSSMVQGGGRELYKGEGVENVRGTLISGTENEAEKLQEVCTCVLIKDSLIEVHV